MRDEKVELMDGETGNKSYVILMANMIAEGVKAIYLEYSGSGDDGAVDVTDGYDSYHEDDTENNPYDMIHELAKIEISNSLKELAEDIMLKLTHADFNNDGCSGTAIFFIENSTLRFKAQHSEYETRTNDTDYDQDLLDGSLL